MLDRSSRSAAFKHLAISFRCGRLANRMILFANFVALSLETGYRIVNPTFQSYAQEFVGTSGNFWCEFPRPRTKSVFDRTGLAMPLRLTRVMSHIWRYAALFNERLRPVSFVETVHEENQPGFTDLTSPEFESRIADHSHIFIYGWMFRAPLLVKKHADRIRQFFTPIAKIRAEAEERISDLKCRADVVVGVHIRQGDYRMWRGGQFFFETSYYARWMISIESLLPDRKVGFLVCSDEPRSENEFEGLAVDFGPGTPAADLHALSLCDYIIGPQSTFTQWAAFYGEVPLLHLGSISDEVGLDRFRLCYLDWPC